MFCIQAVCDLSLPYFTAQIVDVGIQQSGIQDAVPDTMSDRTFERIAAELSEDDEPTFRAAYMQDDAGTWRLKDVSEQERAALDAMMAFPLALQYVPSIAPDVEIEQSIDAYLAGSLSKQQLLDEVALAEQNARELMSDNYDSLIAQQSIAAVKAEYQAVGIEILDIQMPYLLRVGLLMLGLTLLGLIVHCIMNFAACRTSTKIGRDLRTRLFTKVISFSDTEINKFSAASLITRGTNDIQLIQQLCLMLQRMMVYSPILAIGGIFMISQTNVSMGWIVGLAIVLMLVVVGILMAAGQLTRLISVFA